jgi:hypothetical protein
MTEPDALLRHVERDAKLLTGVAILVALLVPGGGARMALAVAGGASISAVSYWAIKRGVTGITHAVLVRNARPGTARRLVALVLRYALLAGIAYVMIARLRLPPVGLLGGASVIPAAAAVELARRRS